MKKSDCLQLLGLMCASLVMGGCLFKAARVPTRQFILTPIPAPEHAPTGAPAAWTVEVRSVKMPSYLLRDSLIVRKSANEVQYLENALWAERLDQGFQQTLTENLSRLLSSNRVSPTISEHGQARVSLSINVKQFDVDTHGQGTLIAAWQLTAPGSKKPVKSGQTILTRSGPSPRRNPQAIATTLSDLMTQFSQELADAIRESVQALR